VHLLEGEDADRAGLLRYSLFSRSSSKRSVARVGKHQLVVAKEQTGRDEIADRSFERGGLREVGCAGADLSDEFGQPHLGRVLGENLDQDGALVA
jgi:hypothetical protein